MPSSPPRNESGCQSESDTPESTSSHSSSSDFEIQAVTTAEGIRTETLAERTDKSVQNERSQDEAEVVNKNHTSPNENLANALGLGMYSESSSSDEDYVTKSTVKPPRPLEKRVRFADDPPEKRQRVEQRNGPVHNPVNGHLRATGDDEADEVAVLAELAEFEAAVEDAGRDTDDIEADLADMEDAREDLEQHELEERVKRLREELERRKAKAKSGPVSNPEERSSLTLDKDGDHGADDLSKIATSFATN